MYKRIKLIMLTLIFMIFIFISTTSISKSNSISISIYPSGDLYDIHAQLSHSNIQSTINAYYDGSDNYYLFLPSYAIDKSLYFHLADSVTLSDQDSSYHNTLTTNLSYSLNSQSMLHILVGSSIPTVYLDLKHDLEYLTSEEYHTLSDSGKAVFLSADGSVCHIGTLDKISGRGNVTWNNNKKPFNISLADSASLYGIPASKDYCLISSYDNSFIRNRLSDTIASTLDLTTMQRKHINLYINGEYQGIYELCEKISATTLEITDLETDSKKSAESTASLTQRTTDEYIQDNGLTPTGKWWDWDNENIFSANGGYILEADITARYQEEASGFALDSGSFIVCKEPTYLTSSQYEYISSYVQTCEDLMFEALSTKDIDTLSNYIDVSSFVAKYLLEEVSKNLDCSSSSQYMYMTDDGILTAGPAWDYDRAYGCMITKNGYDIDFNSPVGFSANMVPGSFVWWQILYYQEDFYQDVITTYKETLYPTITELTKSTIATWEKELTSSAIMDYLKWQHSSSIEDAQLTYHSQIVQVTNFLTNRSEFLKNEWN